MGEFIPSKPGERRAGRQKGTPNKTTVILKDAILMAAERAGGKKGLVGYLQDQALANPGPFMSLLGKVLPTQMIGDPDAPVVLKIERTIVDPANRDSQDIPYTPLAGPL